MERLHKSKNVINAAFISVSLRDHFAGLALQGLCANPGGPFQANCRTGWGFVNCSADDVADTAYLMADAMLKFSDHHPATQAAPMEIEE